MSDNLCTKRYTLNGKSFIEVIVQKRNKSGKVVKRKSRFTKSGNRITSIKAAEQVKNRLRQELDQELQQISNYTWDLWKQKAIDEMRKSGFKESTLLTYEGTLEKWKNPKWDDRILSSFEREDVFEYIHHFLSSKNASDWTKQNISKKIHRLFEMAVDFGEIHKNPARGIKVDAQADDGVALTPGEVEILLSKAKAINHDYYPHWVLAVMTGMRTGELFALRWSNIDFDLGVIHVLKQFTSKDGVHPPKRGKTRTIDLNPELHSFLANLLQKQGHVKHKLWTWKKQRE